jgi:hypothetical protein
MDLRCSLGAIAGLNYANIDQTKIDLGMPIGEDLGAIRSKDSGMFGKGR